MLVIALAIFTAVLMPLYTVYLAWSSRRGGRLTWLLKALGALSFMGFLALIVRWDWLSIYLAYFWWGLIVVVLLLGLRAVRQRQWLEGEKRSELVSIAFEPIVGLALFGFAASGLFHGGEAVNVATPLEGGTFHVGQGGNNTMLNYHNANATQRYALDIGALDGLGRRASGLLPTDLTEYRVYGASIVSPCDGTIAGTRDEIQDNAIGETNVDEPAGNHVVVACNGVEILLAHLQPGSLAVAEGDDVAAGQALGEVGNSGNSTEPHLHIHAVRAGTGGYAEGEAVPLTFDGRFLVRNATFGG